MLPAHVKEFFQGYEEARKNDEIINYYEEKAGDYDKVLEDSGYQSITDYCSKLLRENLENESKKTSVKDVEVLDVGCGSGKTGVSLQKSGFSITDGVDPSKQMLEIAISKKVYRNVVEGILTDIEKFSFEDSKYDGILCVGCFTVGHITLKNGVPEFLRLLKDGGIAVYTISSSMNQLATLEEHVGYFVKQKCEMIKIEKKFYYSPDGVPRYCHIYVIKKL